MPGEIDFRSRPPRLGADVQRVKPDGFPTEWTLDQENDDAAWIESTAVDLQTKINTVEASAGDAHARITTEETTRASADEALATQITTIEAELGTTNAAITAEAIARANADSALAADINTVSTTVAGQTATLTTLQASIDGVALQYGVTGTINGVTGGFTFQGVKRLDGTVTYDMEFDSNVTINGNLLVTGSINTPQLGYNSVSSAPSQSASTVSGTFSSDGNWHDVATISLAGEAGAFSVLYSELLAGVYNPGSGVSTLYWRIWSDASGEITNGLASPNAGPVNVSGAGTYLVTQGFGVELSTPSTTTFRLQVRNLLGGGGGRTLWTAPGCRLTGFVFKR